MMKKAKELLKDKPEFLVGEIRSFVVESLKYRRRSGLEFIAMVLIPLFLFVTTSESVQREEVVKQDYHRIENNKGTTEQTLAVLNLAGGCPATIDYSWIPTYFRERVFGNCRSLSGVNLNHANLNYANLSGSELSSANLSSAQLNSTNLSSANLDYANLDGAVLFQANLSGSKLVHIKLSATLSSANLSGALLLDANLSGATLNSANLSGAILNSANLSSANLDYANLENVRFRCPSSNPCNDMQNITGYENTNWKGIKGWKNVKNIPPKLKKQLNLPQR
jgi:uncharacterized protein YjbI with pentapeptide repeats